MTYSCMCYNTGMDNVNPPLTIDSDDEWLQQVRLCEEALNREAQVDPQSVSVNPLLIPSLLTRARLSDATRRAEERRLALLERKRLALRERKPRDGRVRPWTSKQKTIRERNKKAWRKHSGFGAVLRARGRKALDEKLWKKYIGPIYGEYSHEYLKLKLYKRVPVGIAGVYGKYYGTADYPYTVYTLDVEHKLLGNLYCGREQAVKDGLLPESVLKKPRELSEKAIV